LRRGRIVSLPSSQLLGTPPPRIAARSSSSFVSASPPTLEAARGETLLAFADAPRYGSSLADYVGSPDGAMTPLWVSRASSDARRDARWYAKFFNASTTLSRDVAVTSTATAADGTTTTSAETRRFRYLKVRAVWLLLLLGSRPARVFGAAFRPVGRRQNQVSVATHTKVSALLRVAARCCALLRVAARPRHRVQIEATSAWEVHFVERPADASGGMTVAALEGYFREVIEGGRTLCRALSDCCPPSQRRGTVCRAARGAIRSEGERTRVVSRMKSSPLTQEEEALRVCVGPIVCHRVSSCVIVCHRVSGARGVGPLADVRLRRVVRQPLRHRHVRRRELLEHRRQAARGGPLRRRPARGPSQRKRVA